MRFSIAAGLFLISATMASAQVAVPCGGSFSSFKAAMKAEALKRGHDAAAADRFFAAARQDNAVLRADRGQGFFNNGFVEVSRRMIAQYRLDLGRQKSSQWNAAFTDIERKMGVPRGILLAFWAFETDFGGGQGDFNTLNALMTLGHDCRRPELFQPQVFAMLELYSRGAFPLNTTGAWAGEIGQVQMLPKDILERGIDADGDGKVSLKTSVPDALYSAANMLKGFGWSAGQPWLQEVVMPADFPWEQTGLRTWKRAGDWGRLGVRARSGSFEKGNLPTAILLPEGRKGPAFMAYPNYSTLFEWNQSYVYVTTAAYFATRLSGAPVYAVGNPDPVLSTAQMKQLQRKLEARGYDVGGADGILGAKTRAAVQAEQKRLGMPADAWPTRELLNKL